MEDYKVLLRLQQKSLYVRLGYCFFGSDDVNNVKFLWFDQFLHNYAT
jgi:hypothetical protein